MAQQSQHVESQLPAGDLPLVALAKPERPRPVARTGLAASSSDPVPAGGGPRTFRKQADGALVAAAFMAQQQLRKPCSTVGEMLNDATSRADLSALRCEPCLEPPIAKPPKLFIPDLSRRCSVLSMAFNIYLDKTGLSSWLPTGGYEEEELELYNEFINLGPESPHLQISFDIAERLHTEEIKRQKEEHEMRQQELAREVPIVEPQSEQVQLAPQLDQKSSQSGASPLRKKARTDASVVMPAIPPHLEEQAKRMADLSTLEVDYYVQQLEMWEAEGEAAMASAVEDHVKSTVEIIDIEATG